MPTKTKMNAVSWFEIPATNLARAKKFYENVLGIMLATEKMGPMDMEWFPMAQDGPGACGSLVKADGYKPSRSGTLVYLLVDDVEAALSRVKKNGGKEVLPKTSIGEYGFIGQFEDTEGNRVALHSRK